MHSTLLILTPGFAKDEKDSTCMPFIQSFIRTVNKQYNGLELIIISLDFPFTNKEYSWFGNRVIPLNGNKDKFRPLLWLKLYRLLKKLSKQKQLCGILNFWCADNALVTHYFSKWNKVVHYTWLQGQDAKKKNKALWFFRPKKESLIALSPFLKETFYSNHSINPAYTIYPGINESLFENIVTDKNIDIIGVGSLTSLKQYSLFIEVVEKIKNVYPSVRTIIIGAGPEEARLRKLISEKQLENNIELKGCLDHADVIHLMQRARLLLHTSYYEGYGMVCLEALASGCHVISFIAPENNTIAHWHIAKNVNEMFAKAREILSLPGEAFYPVIPRKINDSVRQLMALFTNDRPDYRAAEVSPHASSGQSL